MDEIEEGNGSDDDDREEEKAEIETNENNNSDEDEEENSGSDDDDEDDENDSNRNGRKQKKKGGKKGKNKKNSKEEKKRRMENIRHSIEDAILFGGKAATKKNKFSKAYESLWKRLIDGCFELITNEEIDNDNGCIDIVLQWCRFFTKLSCGLLVIVSSKKW